MSMRYPGGLIASTPVTANYPSGVWTQAQAIPYQAQNVWTRDQFWPYTTLLLQGDGAVNGAQNNTFLDSSSNNFTITRNGNTTQGAFTPYEQDGYWSNYFDGSGDYLTTPSNTAFAFGTGDFTVEAFVFITATNSQNLRVFTTAGVGSDFAFEINTSLQLAHFNGSTTLTLGGSVPLNQWVHIAWVRSGSTVTGYINGVSIGTATSSANMSNSQTISIGATANYTSGQTAYISNLRVVKGTAVYTSAFTPSTAPLTAITNTSLLTCQSNRFKDNSTNNFTLTVNGDTSVQAFQPFPGATTWSASVLGGSGYFDGSGDYLATPSSTNFAFGGDWTYEFWLYPVSQSSAGGLVAFSDNRDNLDYTQSTNTLSFYNGSSSTSFTGVSPTVSAWNHVAIVNSGGTVRAYVNGVQSTNTASGVTTSSARSINIVANQAGSNITQCYIASFRVVKGTAVYTAAFTPPTTPLTAITNTQLLLNFTNAGIYDNSMMNNLETVGNAQVSTSVVKYGTGSMAFDGSGDYLKYLGTNVAGLGSGNFTIEFWINAPSLNDKFILGLRGGMSGSPHVTTGGYGGTTVGALRWASSAGEILSGTTVITDNTWHHCAIVRNGSTITLYVDGISRGSGTDTTAFNGNGGQILIGENDLGTNTFTGYLDDLRITRGVARYLTSFTPPIARLPAQ